VCVCLVCVFEVDVDERKMVDDGGEGPLSTPPSSLNERPRLNLIRHRPTNGVSQTPFTLVNEPPVGVRSFFLLNTVTQKETAPLSYVSGVDGNGPLIGYSSECPSKLETSYPSIATND